MQPIIEVDGLTKRYKGATVNAVDAVSFSVMPGEFFALLGPNGAGKTTTISILTTTLSPTSGAARIAGYDIRSRSAQVRRSVGIIFQRPSLDLNLTAEENVRFHALLYGLHPWRPTFSTMPADYRRRVQELAALLGIERDLFKALRTFSGGMRRKLEIVRGLLHRPLVLFLDEPTAGLDVPSRRSLWDYLGKVRRESRTTIFLTTHYIEEAEAADRCCILGQGSDRLARHARAGQGAARRGVPPRRRRGSGRAAPGARAPRRPLQRGPARAHRPERPERARAAEVHRRAADGGEDARALPRGRLHGDRGAGERMIEASAVLTIAQRDFTKLVRDRWRVATDVVTPVLVFGLLGGMLNFSFGRAIGYDFLVYVLTGVYAQSLFQSAAMGMIFLIEDRENDFSQEVFVSPISRYSIVFGKILGESLVALPQGLAALLFLLVIGVRLAPEQVVGLLGVTAVVCLSGGAFGLMVLAGLQSRRVANQIFSFVMLPQYFLAGVFNPLQDLPAWLEVASRLAPMRYAVDLTRHIFYAGRAEYEKVVLDAPALDLAVIAVLFAVFLPIGTFLFVRAERNR